MPPKHVAPCADNARPNLAGVPVAFKPELTQPPTNTSLVILVSHVGSCDFNFPNPNDLNQSVQL